MTILIDVELSFFRAGKTFCILSVLYRRIVTHVFTALESFGFDRDRFAVCFALYCWFRAVQHDDNLDFFFLRRFLELADRLCRGFTCRRQVRPRRDHVHGDQSVRHADRNVHRAPERRDVQDQLHTV